MTRQHAESLVVFVALIGSCVALVAIYDLARWWAHGPDATITFALRAVQQRWPWLRALLWLVVFCLAWIADRHLFANREFSSACPTALPWPYEVARRSPSPAPPRQAVQRTWR